MRSLLLTTAAVGLLAASAAADPLVLNNGQLDRIVAGQEMDGIVIDITGVFDNLPLIIPVDVDENPNEFHFEGSPPIVEPIWFLIPNITIRQPAPPDPG